MTSDRHAVPDIIARLPEILPSAVAHAGSFIAHAQEALYPVEAATLTRAVEKRRREFTAGRTFARAAMRHLGREPSALPVGPKRAPIWPAGILGSITHTDTVGAAIVGFESAYVGIGIDIEHAAPLSAEIRPMIVRPDDFQSAPDGIDPGKLTFVIKEAIYKAYNPGTGVFLDFEDVSVSLDSRGRTFTGTLVNPDKPPVAGYRHFDGRFIATSEHLAAVVMLPRRG